MSDLGTPPLLSPEQEVMRDTWGKGMAVLAGAGSGKTTTLVAKCERLLQRDPKARFIAVSFTERSASDLRSKLSESFMRLGDLRALNQNWIMTIHGLCGTILREFPKEAGFEGEETILVEAEAQLLWNRVVDGLWSDELSGPLQEDFDFLLLRESQAGLSSLVRRARELALFGVLDSLQVQEDSASQSLRRLANDVLEKYRRLKQRQGVIDFNDMELGADRALSYSHVRESYHRRFQLILVDEFQDTNPIQGRIIWSLARPDLSNLCVVGDPKQSIYRFRDADVSVFEEYCAKLPVNLSLTWNFRSRPGIIEFVNEVCEKAFTASEMQFKALIPKKEIVKEGEPSVLQLNIEDPQDLADWIQNEVQRGVPLHEMALLVRRIRGNEKWLKALAARGIPIAVGSGGFFWEDPRVRELVAFLRWWDNPGHSLSGAIFLRAPWMGIPDRDLDCWVRRDPTWRIPFFASDHPIAEKLRPFLNQVVRPGLLLLELQMEEELGAALLGLWHRVEDGSSRGLDFHEVVMELTRAIEENRREAEVPAPRNQGQLSVLTLHGAKGLEFSHVLLIDFSGKSRASDMPLLFWDRHQGAYLGRRDLQGDRDRKNSEEAKWRELEKKKNLEESKRLFYVALTRAKERIVLVFKKLEETEESRQSEAMKKRVLDQKSVFIQDNWRAWIDFSVRNLKSPTIYQELDHKTNPVKNIDQEICLEKNDKKNLTTLRISQNKIDTDKFDQNKFNKNKLNQNKLDQDKLEWIRSRHSVTEWTLLSQCPRAYEWTFIRPVNPTPSVEELGLSTGEKIPTWLENEMSYQELGKRVHSCLERGDYQGLKTIEDEVGVERFMAEPVMSWALSSPWMAPAQPEKGREVWTELAFEVPKGNEIIVGSMDRVVSYREGDSVRYSIIDFKVTERRRSVDALLRSYQTQIELYAWALSKLIGDTQEGGGTQNPKGCSENQPKQRSNIEALLVNISAKAIQAVSVPLGQLNLDFLAQSAYEIVNGKSGNPQPSYLCRYCEFRSKCPESQSSTQGQG